MLPMFTVADLTRLFGLKSKTTIRAWAETFSDFLSERANPDKGTARFFTEQDAAALYTVHRLKQSGMDSNQIAAALSAGDLYELPAQETAQDGTGSAEEVHGGTSALVTRLTATLGQYEARAAALEEERNRLLKERDSERGRNDELIAKIEKVKEANAAAILDAERRAAAAQTRADLLASQLEEANAAAQAQDSRPVGWLARLFKRG